MATIEAVHPQTRSTAAAQSAAALPTRTVWNRWKFDEQKKNSVTDGFTDGYSDSKSCAES